jgi:Tfp pilus assembly protein PilO
MQKLIRGLLIAVLVIDLGLGALNWRMAAAPRDPADELRLLRQQRALLAADVARARQIRASLPEVERNGVEFFQTQIAPSATGYSALMENLGKIAAETGVRTGNISYQRSQPDKRGVEQIEIGASVTGEYASIVRFINGLEHSDTFYVLDGLQLGASSTGGLALNLRLRTYFRTT